MKKIALLYILIFIIGTATAHVTLVYPEGGETFSPGQEISIEWEELVQHNTENWDLFYSLDGGDTWEELAMDLDYELRTYDWTIPETSSAEARIKVIQDNTGFDYEDESGDFTIMSPVGTNENSVQELFVFPNPATDRLHIRLKEPLAEFSVFDLKGRRLYHEDVRNRNEHILDLSSMQPGMYILRVSYGQEQIRSRFIKH